MVSEIGSNFWIDPNKTFNTDKAVTPDIFGVAGSDYVWTSTGRSAISLVIGEIERRKRKMRKVVLLPSYTCHTVLEPFLKAGYTLKALPVDEKLYTGKEMLLKAIEESKPDILFVHRYFGFDTMPDCYEWMVDMKQEFGIEVIEDRTQCLYSSFSIFKADYIIGSIRKWHGVPDGGFAVCGQGDFEKRPVEADKVLEQAKVEASILKYNYLFQHKGNKEEFLSKYCQAERILDQQTEVYAISPLSLGMQAGLDAVKLREKRIYNYRYLMDGIKDLRGITPLFPDLSEGVVPLYCPIYVKERKELQKFLAENSIYAPVVWPRAQNLPPIRGMAEMLYKNLLCLPIDQRYGQEEMRRIRECLNRYVEK